MMGNFVAASAIDQDDGPRNQDDGQDDGQDDKPKKIDQNKMRKKHLLMGREARMNHPKLGLSSWLKHKAAR